MEDLILTVRGRRLVKEIKRLRLAAGIKSASRAAKQLGTSESTLWRMENGKTRILPDVLDSMLDLYGVTSPEREALERLCFDSLRRGWWTPYSDVFAGSYVALESDAAQICVLAFVVPGFFQTEDYARAAIASTRLGLDCTEVDHRMEARLARQRALFVDREEPPTVRLLLDESVVRRVVGGPDAMRAQLNKLIEVSEWPNVTIHVLPFSAGFHAGMDGEFVIIDFPEPEDEPFVYEEGLAGDVYLEAPEELERYRLAFDHALDATLEPASSRQMMAQTAKEIA